MITKESVYICKFDLDLSVEAEWRIEDIGEDTQKMGVVLNDFSIVWGDSNSSKKDISQFEVENKNLDFSELVRNELFEECSIELSDFEDESYDI